MFVLPCRRFRSNWATTCSRSPSRKGQGRRTAPNTPKLGGRYASVGNATSTALQVLASIMRKRTCDVP